MRPIKERLLALQGMPPDAVTNITVGDLTFLLGGVHAAEWMDQAICKKLPEDMTERERALHQSITALYYHQDLVPREGET